MAVDMNNRVDCLIQYLDSSEFESASSSAPRLIAKLKAALESQELYEAHQIIRTINFRFLRTDDKLRNLVKLLYLGSVYLIRANEDASGQDLALLFLEASSKALQTKHRTSSEQSGVTPPAEDKLLEFHKTHSTFEYAISEMASELAIILPKTDLGQRKYIADVNKYLNNSIIHPFILHATFASKFYANNDFFNARYHFLISANNENCSEIATFLIHYHLKHGYQVEVDMFIAQFIFQFLCLQSPIDPVLRQPMARRQKNTLVLTRTRKQIKEVASQIFVKYSQQHPQLQSRNQQFPLLNFTQFLIGIIDTEEVDTFNVLFRIYGPVLKKDPIFQDYLFKIGTLYFGIPNPSEDRGGLLGNIMQMFSTDDDQDEEFIYDDLE